MGGEKAYNVWCCSLLGGSPPRGRGKVLVTRSLVSRTGITPAWAGKSCLYVLSRSSVRDHPRVGGEKKLILFVLRAVTGSPPRGRGKVLVTRSLVSRTGITPAWAGKSCLYVLSRSSVRDHPRVGGEKKLILFVLRAVTGSPPRGRGKDTHKAAQAHREGITPAWAGKSPDNKEISGRV